MDLRATPASRALEPTAQPTAGAGQGPGRHGSGRVQRGRAVGYATVTFGAPVDDIPPADVSALLEAVQAANGADGLTVGASGQALEAAAAEPPSSEGIGVTSPWYPAVRVRIPDRCVASVVTALLSLGVGQALC